MKEDILRPVSSSSPAACWRFTAFRGTECFWCALKDCVCLNPRDLLSRCDAWHEADERVREDIPSSKVLLGMRRSIWQWRKIQNKTALSSFLFFIYLLSFLFVHLVSCFHLKSVLSRKRVPCSILPRKDKQKNKNDHLIYVYYWQRAMSSFCEHAPGGVGIGSNVIDQRRSFLLPDLWDHHGPCSSERINPRFDDRSMSFGTFDRSKI